MVSYKIIIPIVLKDIDLMLDNIDEIQYNLGASRVVFIGKSEIKQHIAHLDFVEFIDEEKLYSGLNIESVKKIINDKINLSNRAGWYFQQFLKMAYSYICEDEYYLVWDSDTLPLKKIDFFNAEEKPFLSYKSFQKFDLAYFETIRRLLNIDVEINTDTKSFVVEHMLFNADIMKKLIDAIEQNLNINGEVFFEKIINAIPEKNLNLSGFSEFETYVAFVKNNYPNVYNFRIWNNLRCGKIFLGSEPDKKSLQWVSKSFDTVSIERYDSQWKIFKLKWIKKNNFSKVYKIVSPIIIMNYSVRMYVRKYLKNIYVKKMNKVIKF